MLGGAPISGHRGGQHEASEVHAADLAPEICHVGSGQSSNPGCCGRVQGAAIKLKLQ